MEAILRREITSDGARGVLAVIVSIRSSLADDVRDSVTRLSRGAGFIRSFVLIDEAFNW